MARSFSAFPIFRLSVAQSHQTKVREKLSRENVMARPQFKRLLFIYGSARGCSPIQIIPRLGIFCYGFNHAIR